MPARILNGMVTLANMIELGQVKKGLMSPAKAPPAGRKHIAHLLQMPNPTRQDIKQVFASLTLGSGACALVMSHKSVSKFGHRPARRRDALRTEFNDLCQGDLFEYEHRFGKTAAGRLQACAHHLG